MILSEIQVLLLYTISLSGSIIVHPSTPLCQCVMCRARQCLDLGFGLGWVGFGIWGLYGRGFSEWVAAPTHLSCLGFLVASDWLVARRAERQEGYKLRGTGSWRCYSITKLTYFWVLSSLFIQCSGL